MIDFDDLNVGDTVLYRHKTTHVTTPYYGTVLEVLECKDAEGRRLRGLGTRMFKVKFVSRGCGAPDGVFMGYELTKVEGTAQENERRYSSAPLPRWA